MGAVTCLVHHHSTFTDNVTKDLLNLFPSFKFQDSTTSTNQVIRAIFPQFSEIDPPIGTEIALLTVAIFVFNKPVSVSVSYF